MADHFAFSPTCKYTVLAINSVRVDIPPDLILQDGTRVVLESFRFALDNHWKDWLGTIQVNNLQACNLVLVRTATEGWPDGDLQASCDELSLRLPPTSC